MYKRYSPVLDAIERLGFKIEHMPKGWILINGCLEVNTKTRTFFDQRSDDGGKYDRLLTLLDERFEPTHTMRYPPYMGSAVRKQDVKSVHLKLKKESTEGVPVKPAPFIPDLVLYQSQDVELMNVKLNILIVLTAICIAVCGATLATFLKFS